MCPPGVDQTTRSSPQWNLLAPQLQQRQSLPKPEKAGYGYGPREFIRGDQTWDAFEKLARIPSNAYERPRSLLPFRIQPGSPAVASVLEALPAEILQMVITELDIPGKVALALCSQNLWCHVLGKLQVQCQKEVAPWAGSPIICTGTWLQGLPTSIYTLFPELEKENEEWRRLPPRRGMAPAREWNWGTYEYSDVGERDMEHQYRQALSKHTESLGMAQKLHQALDKRLEQAFHSPRDLANAWVLRNLTTREVVHLKLTPRKRMGDPWVAVKGLPWLTIDIALILRICWQADAHGSASGGSDEVYTGAWAGHCFDVIETSTFDDKELWQDVTGEIIAVAKSLKVGDFTWD